MNTTLRAWSDYVVEVDGTAESMMFTAVDGTGGTRGVVDSGTNGIDIDVSTLVLEVFICGCSTLLSLSLRAFRAICLQHNNEVG